MSTLTSTSTSVTAEYDSSTLANEIRKYKWDELIKFLRKQNLDLSPKVINTLEGEEINGRVFLKMSKEEFLSIGLGFRPAKDLADFAKECRKKKPRSFSTHKTKKDLKEVLAKYEVETGRITDIPQFVPSKFFLKSNFLQNCITNIWYFIDL
jgi:hypothetical protein